jgi:hypothetical protein
MNPPVISPPVISPPVISPPVISPPVAPSPAPIPMPITTPTSPPTSNPTTPSPARPPFRPGASGHQTQLSGIVRKSPNFYEDYTGPKLAELNAVRASAELSRGGKFTFTGTDQGRINMAPAVFVWGIERNENLPPGPFTDRPNIKFDAVVIVTLAPKHHVTAKVVDFTNGASTDLSARSASIKGSTVSVTVPSSLLPSTGLPMSQYRFNYWPEDGGPPISSSVSSFAPEFTTAQVGILR